MPHKARRIDTKQPVWPSRSAAAADLAQILGRRVTAETLTRTWLADPTCPLPRGRGPIPKAPLIAWAKARPGPGKPPEEGAAPQQTTIPGTDQPTPRVRLVLAQARLAEEKARRQADMSIPVDEARAGILLAMEGLKTALLGDVPRAAAALAAGKPLGEAETIIREHNAAALNAFATAADDAITKAGA